MHVQGTTHAVHKLKTSRRSLRKSLCPSQQCSSIELTSSGWQRETSAHPAVCADPSSELRRCTAAPGVRTASYPRAAAASQAASWRVLAAG